MAGQLTLSVLEIIVLMAGAIIVGITIHFFIVSRRSLKDSIEETPGSRIKKEFSDWKLRYFNDIEQRDKEIINLKFRLAEAEENHSIYSIEAEEKGIKNKKLMAEIETLRSSIPSGEIPDYTEQLRNAQSGLLEQNEKINQLLGKINIEKESESKQQEMQKINAALSGEINELRSMLAQKEKEVSTIREKEKLTTEMTSLLDSTYNEFNVLQDKIQKLESQVISSKTTKIEYEEIKEGYVKISRDFEEQKLKNNVLESENRQLKANLSETEEKLIESNYQRQQMQKRVIYLEEINRDMLAVADAQKKLEGQIKRIGELESMLNIVSEERNDMANRK
jgi:chromosome segregation ATPase